MMNIQELSTVVVAIATVVYATLTYFLLKETREGKKKPVLEEMISVVIHPLLNQVQKEILALRDKNFEWNHNLETTVCRELIPDTIGAESIVYENLSRVYPDIPTLLRNHDIILPNLKNSLKNLGDGLLSLGFKEKCIELIKEYNLSAKGTGLSESDFVYLLMNFIDNYVELPMSYGTYGFWKINKDKLLDFRNKEEVKELIKTVEGNAEKVLHACEKIEDTLLRIINLFSKKYGIEIAKYQTIYEGV